MAIRFNPLPAAVAAGVLLAAGPSPAANPTPPRDCFLANTWEGWTAPGDGDALYLRIRLNDIYRVELTPGSHARKNGDQFLISRIRGSSWICSAVDLDLSLSDSFGFQQPLIARSLRKLTPQEIAAIPRKDLP